MIGRLEEDKSRNFSTPPSGGNGWYKNLVCVKAKVRTDPLTIIVCGGVDVFIKIYLREGIEKKEGN